MTAIAGIADRKTGRVWLGADSLASGAYDAYNLAAPKVFRSGPCLIGVAGSPRVAQIIQYHIGVRGVPSTKEALKFMVTAFVPQLRETLATHGAKLRKDEVEEIADGSWALVGLSGRIFAICSDFQVVERAEGLGAIGCGMQYLLGSLHETEGRKISPRQRIRKALSCAELYSNGVRGPFTILSAGGKNKCASIR